MVDTARPKESGPSSSSSSRANVGVFDALHVEYSEMADWYDDFWKGYLDRTLREPLTLVRKAVKTNASVVVDVGCGTGVFFRRYVDEHRKTQEGDLPKLIGVEPSGAMLEQARQKFNHNDDDDENEERLVDWRQAPAEALPVEDESADVVCSTSAFHFFRDKVAALREMKRVLKPGGSLVITDWCNDYLLVKLYHNVFERLRWMRFRHKYPGPLGRRQLVEMVQNSGLANVNVETYRIRLWKIFPWGMQTVTATKPR